MAKKRLSCRIEEELVDYIDWYAKEYDLDKTKALEIMILAMKDKNKVVPKDKLEKFLISSAKISIDCLSQLKGMK